MRFKSYSQDQPLLLPPDLRDLIPDDDEVLVVDDFMDGTKIAANTREHSAVWRKNTERFKARVQERANQIIGKADQVNADLSDEDDSDSNDNDGGGPTSAELRDQAGTGCTRMLAMEMIRTAAN